MAYRPLPVLLLLHLTLFLFLKLSVRPYLRRTPAEIEVFDGGGGDRAPSQRLQVQGSLATGGGLHPLLDDDQPSYHRLEFIGDTALGLTIANFVLFTNPTLGPGPLTLLRSANIYTEKLARAAVRHGLYRFVRHTSTTLDHLVEEFTAMVMKEAMEDAGRMQHGGYIKAPKVLVDIVESFAAAVYIDCDYNLEIFWKVFRGMLEPLITEETVVEQPVAALYILCQKHGRRLDIKNQIEGSLNIVSILVDEQLVCTESSEQKSMARINTARTALRLLPSAPVVDSCSVATGDEAAGKKDDECKQRLHSLCDKNHWEYVSNLTTV